MKDNNVIDFRKHNVSGDINQLLLIKNEAADTPLARELIRP